MAFAVDETVDLRNFDTADRPGSDFRATAQLVH